MSTDLLKTKNMFLSQSIDDAWSDYQNSLTKKNFAHWDFVILTASNESQAEAYNEQIKMRLENGRLPKATHYAVIPDPNGLRVGSGGATFNVMKYIAQSGVKDFATKKILVIHSGGDSKRVPQYSACGKLFSPVPRALPNTEISTLFDEFIISMSGIPARMQGGMLVLSGDVLLLFNPLQIDMQFGDAVAVSIKEAVETGKNHGVFLRGKKGMVKSFLHKMSEQQLKNTGAVNDKGLVDIDTGAVMLSGRVLNALYSLVKTDSFDAFVNDRARISFYGDFLYPLAESSSLEEYLTQKPEGEFCDELTYCRKQLWNTLHGFKLQLLNLSPAEFVHFGTTKELLELVTKNIDAYKYLGWSRHVRSTGAQTHYSSTNSLIDKSAVIGEGSYIENSIISADTVVGKNCVISCVELRGVTVPDNTVLHCLKEKNGNFTVRFYGSNDDPKQNVLFGKEWGKIPLWQQPLYRQCKTMLEAVSDSVETIKKILCGEEIAASERISLCESFNNADVGAASDYLHELSENVRAELFVSALEKRMSVSETVGILGQKITNEAAFAAEKAAKKRGIPIHMRACYYLSRLCGDDRAEGYEKQAFSLIRNEIAKGTVINKQQLSFAKDEIKVQLPVRVNWGGGWSDTPPYCIENGGTVLNAAIKLNGKRPIEVCVRRLEKPVVILESADAGAYGEFDDITKLQGCGDPFDPFALHKAALLSFGVIPESGSSVRELCSLLGGGLYLSTQVEGIPRGSGLGTSSILASACIEALCKTFGVKEEYNRKIEMVLCMEQLMSTGGGWQDQAGGLIPGIKLLTTEPGISQKVSYVQLALSDKTLNELKNRFVIIYTGQRRLARNLLREVMGRYISGNPTSTKILHEIQRKAVLMKFELEKGNIDEFAELMNEHWELSKKLDNGCTNTCIEQIFDSCADLLDGKMICGAGGGGFLQAVLKKDVTKEILCKRLNSVFNESGIDVWQCEFDM